MVLPPPLLQPAVRLRLVPTSDEAQPVVVWIEYAVTDRVQLQLIVLEDDSIAVAIIPAACERCGCTADMPGSLSASPRLLCYGADEPAPALAGQVAQADQQTAALQRQHAELLRENHRLQSLVRQHLDGITKASRKTLQHAGGQLMEGAEQRYLLALHQLHRLLADKTEAAAAAEAALAPERARLAAASAQAQAQRDRLMRFVSDVAAASGQAAAAGRIKAPLSATAVQGFLAAEPRKGGQVRALRAAHARLSHQLAAAERRLKQADQLSAEGLHLVDYEQLRIENASLAAKREARAAEVEKLRGKLGQAVQITAHVREKLHCLELERAALESRLAAAELAVQDARGRMTAERAHKERAQRDHSQLTQDWRIVSNPRCLADMQQHEAKLQELTAQAVALQAQYEALGGTSIGMGVPSRAG